MDYKWILYESGIGHFIQIQLNLIVLKMYGLINLPQILPVAELQGQPRDYVLILIKHDLISLIFFI